MAYILLLDESEVAGRAMRGILARGNHHCVMATSTADAWRLLREGVVIDLVFLELKLAPRDGLAFLQRVRDDWFWRKLPVVVYTYDTDPNLVHRALELGVQNYLIKPYGEALVHAEIAKAGLNPWYNQPFEEPRSFCAQCGLTRDRLEEMRRDVMDGFDEARKAFPLWAEGRVNSEAFARLDSLTAAAGAAGIRAGVDCLRHLRAQAEADNWAVFWNCAEPLEYARRLIYCQLNPDHVPECLQSDRERDELREATERARWSGPDVDANGPVIASAEIEKQVNLLSGCPVIDAAAATFHMAADGRAPSMTHVMDLAALDPGLCAQILTAANKLEHDELAPIDDPQTAVNLLGEIRLHAMATAFPVAYERHMNLPPLTWINFWMFLVGVGRVSQFICNYLDFPYLNSRAFTAGLLHDLGKLILLKVQPIGFQTIVRYAQRRRVPMHAAEGKHIGCTSRDIGVRFAEKNRLPPIYTNVIRWVESPDLATDHIDLVAMISLARHVCLHNHVGYCGDTPDDSCPPIAATAAWSVLQPRLFPSFDLRKFEAQAHAYCVNLRSDLAVEGCARLKPATERTAAMADR